MEPLEKRTISVGKDLRPALHPDWVSDDVFLPYQTLPQSHNEEERMDWLISTDLILDDLKHLLNQPCHVFWSYLIFCDTLRANLDSFLKLSPRELDGQVKEQELSKQHRRLYEMYFKVFIRMTTCKESTENFLSPDVFGRILYDNFILDVPKIIDMCVLFGTANHKLIVKMVENVFKHQPNYQSDVEHAVPSLVKLFKELIQRISDDKLVEPRDLSISEMRSADVDILDLSLYASDMCHSLYSFLQVYSPACLPFHEPSIYKTLSTFYEDVLGKLLDQLESATLSAEKQKVAYRRLSLAQEDCVSLFRHILFTCTLGRAISHGISPHSAVQEFYDIMTESLGDVRFMGHYGHKFSFEEDLEIIANLDIQSDMTRQCFIREGVEAAALQRNLELKKASQSDRPSTNSTHQPLEKARNSQTTVTTQSVATGGAAAAPTPTEDGSKPPEIAELFPHLGQGYIEMCLRYFHTVGEVVSALLEDNLPESLRKLDPALAVAPEEDSLVTSRRNVFDNDQFDVFRKKITDTSKVHRGKRDSGLSTPDTDQKSKIKDLVSSYDQLALAEGAAAAEFDMYDDEYDDTYDANEVGADDADEAMELMGRKMVVPVALGGSGMADEQNEAADNERRNDERTFNNNQTDQHPKYDVKGRAKGQGQSTEVTRNRNFKTAHKARGANHNRKAGARSKMSKGMF